jgi:hypothetical protein
VVVTHYRWRHGKVWPVQSFFFMEDSMVGGIVNLGGGNVLTIPGAGGKSHGAGPTGSGSEDPLITLMQYLLLSDEEKQKYMQDPSNPGQYMLNPELVF